MAGVSVPLHAAEHFYVVTEPMDLPSNLPVMRNMDSCAYYKEDAGKLLIGAFEPKAKPWGMDGIPESFCFDELPEDFDHFQPILEGAIHRVPKLGETGIRKFFNGPESFSPDQRYLLGEAPELKNFFVAAGFNSIGIQSAGGAGMALAEWIVGGHPPFDLWDVDIRRMSPHQNRKTYLYDRVSEALGLLYAMHWPYRQYETARGIKLTPLYMRLKENGACFGEVAGWERANWFAPKGVEPKYEYSFKRQNWFAHSAAEVKATREKVALFDQSTFAKFLVRGADAERELQRICAADVAVAPGPRGLYPMAEPARRDRGRSHRHAPGRGLLHGGDRGGDRRARSPLADAQCRAGCARSDRRRDQQPGRAGRDGTEQPRLAAASLAIPISAMRPFPSGPRARSPSAMSGSAPPASAIWASWAGSSMCPANSPPASSIRCWPMASRMG